jgi:chromosome segregation ATPase
MATVPALSPPQPAPSGMATSQRKASGPLARDGALPPLPADANGAPSWRSNPHSSSPNNKTSRYIDKVTSENERLLRELKAERLAREEETKRIAAARTAAEDLHAEYQHLQVLADTNARALERKDRKLEELAAALETEKARRIAAEKKADEALGLLDITQTEAQKEVSKAKELQMHAEANSNASRDGFKRLNEKYHRQVKSLRDDLETVRKEGQNQADQIRRHLMINQQIRQELGRLQNADNQLQRRFEEMKAHYEKELEKLAKEARELRAAIPAREAQAAALVTEMEEVRDKMKWVMAQDRRNQQQ